MFFFLWLWNSVKVFILLKTTAMKTKETFRIQIPRPCHEDWNKMTPNEKGAHCSVCNKTVVDFSSRSLEDIKAELNAAKGKKVCGRFNAQQLSSTKKAILHLRISLQKLPRNISIAKAFGIALFLAFGTSLFSCSTPQGHLVGEIEVVDTLAGKVDSVHQENQLMGDTVLVPEEQEHIKGEVKSTHCDPPKKVLICR